MVSFLKRIREEVLAIEGKEEVKQVIAVRTDLGMSQGKLAAQVAHASVGAFVNTEHNNAEMARLWLKGGQKKVVLGIPSPEELKGLEEKAKANGLAFEAVSDAGRTELAPGTSTCIAIGPDVDEEIDKLTGSLPLLK